MRLGEHDTRTTEDGAHLDVVPHLVESHEDWNNTLIINDIAIVHFKKDVDFNGEFWKCFVRKIRFF